VKLPIAVVLVLLARTAGAGKWCGYTEPTWAPAGKTVPRHPHLVFHRGLVLWALRDKYPTHLEHVVAKIDGTPVRVKVSDVTAGGVQLASLEVLSERTGKLEISLTAVHSREYFGEQAEREWKGEFTIDPDWRAPSATSPVVTRYRIARGSENPEAPNQPDTYAHGVQIATDLPAIAFTARWRRDDKDTWRTISLPAIERGGRATARLGETTCTAATVPLAFLERGIELELTAQLPDGKQVAIPLPRPLVVPKTVTADPDE
jgi:hypothetical protein